MNKPPPFIAFDESKATRMYRGNLPHWRQEGATYFVTFRLGDSLPQEILEQWKKQQEWWLHAHHITWDNQGHWREAFESLPKEERLEFQKRFDRAIQNYLDKGYGSCLLKEPGLREWVENALTYFHTTRFWLGDYVLMPNHIHAFMSPADGEDLEEILGSIKSFCARRINQQIGKTGEKFWQKESYDHIVRDIDQVKVLRQYNAENPSKANLKDEDYTYHRASWMDEWMV